MKDAAKKLTSQCRCQQTRLKILELSQLVPALHVAPAFSCVEILDFVYHDICVDPKSSSGKRFILSKGHGAITLYVMMNKFGLLQDEELAKYCSSNGLLGAHPDRGTPGVIASTGSLGHGLGLATGLAYGQFLQKNSDEVVVLVSDGELQEGSSWEAAMMATNLQLSNLTVLVDLNDFGGMDRMSKHHKGFYPLDAKFEAFGFEVVNCDGHSVSDMRRAYQSLSSSKPKCLICKTIKGKGVSFMENIPIWHYRSPNKTELEKAILEITGDI